MLLFWDSCILPHGFQIQSGYLACTLSCLCTVILKVTTGVTPAISTNRGVHCINMYMAWLARLLSHDCAFLYLLSCTTHPKTDHDEIGHSRFSSHVVVM